MSKSERYERFGCGSSWGEEPFVRESRDEIGAKIPITPWCFWKWKEEKVFLQGYEKRTPQASLSAGAPKLLVQENKDITLTGQLAAQVVQQIEVEQSETDNAGEKIVQVRQRRMKKKRERKKSCWGDIFFFSWEVVCSCLATSFLGVWIKRYHKTSLCKKHL